MKTPSQTPRYSWNRLTLELAVLAGAAFLFCLGEASAQAGSKESQKLIDYSEDAKKALVNARSEVDNAMGLYNSLVTGEPEKPEATYKKLVKSLEKCQKTADKTRDRVDKMQQQADVVFRQWALDLEGYENENLKNLGMQRFEVSQQRYNTMIERMLAASEIYQPLMSSLTDQVKYMGFDLSTEAMSALHEPAEELNELANNLYAEIDAILAEQTQDEAALAGNDETDVEASTN